MRSRGLGDVYMSQVREAADVSMRMLFRVCARLCQFCLHGSGYFYIYGSV